MIRNIQLRVSLKEEGTIGLKAKTAKYVGVSEKEIEIKIQRKSIDARKPSIYFNYKLEVYINEPMPKGKAYSFDYKDVSKAKEVHIVGFGPAGMWAALRCLELGFKPVVLERGKNVQ